MGRFCTVAFLFLMQHGTLLLPTDLCLQYLQRSLSTGSQLLKNRSLFVLVFISETSCFIWCAISLFWFLACLFSKTSFKMFSYMSVFFFFLIGNIMFTFYFFPYFWKQSPKLPLPQLLNLCQNIPECSLKVSSSQFLILIFFTTFYPCGICPSVISFWNGLR